LEGTDKAKYRLRGGTNQSIEVGQTGVSNSNSTITSRGAIRREHESISDSRVHPGLLSGTGPLGAGLARGRRLLPELCRKPPRKVRCRPADFPRKRLRDYANAARQRALHRCSTPARSRPERGRRERLCKL